MALTANQDWLYKQMSGMNVNLGSEEQFAQAMQDESNRQWVYEQAGKMGIDLGTPEQFASAMQMPDAEGMKPKIQPDPLNDERSRAFGQMQDPLYSGQYQYHQQVADKEAQMQREEQAQLPITERDRQLQEQIRQKEIEGKWGKPNGTTFGVDSQTGMPTITNTEGNGAHLYAGEQLANQDEIDALKGQLPSYLTREVKTPEDLLVNTAEAWSSNTEMGRDFKNMLDAGTITPEEYKQAMIDANEDYINQQTRILGQEATNATISDISKTINPIIEQLKTERHKAMQRAAGQGQMRGGAYGAIGAQMSANTAYDMKKDAVLSEYLQAQQYLVDAIKISEAAQKGQGFWKGLGGSLGDVDTWDMGISQLVRSANLKKIVEKYEKKPDSLTDSEKALMDAAVAYMSACAYNSDKLSRLYKAGQTTGESLPFMLQFAVMPIGAIKNKVAKGILGYGIEQFGGKALQTAGKYTFGRAAAETGTALLGNIAAAGVQTAAFGAPKITEGTISRMTGDIKPEFDENGRIIYGGRENQQGLGEALWNAGVDTYVENLSEMILTSGDPIKAWVGGTNLFKNLSKNETIQVLAKIGDKWSGSTMGKIAGQMQFRNYPEEVAEEYVGNLLRWGMSTDVHSAAEAGLDADSQIDLWIGLAPTSIAFAGLGLGEYSVRGGIDRFQSSQAARKLRNIMLEGEERKYLDNLLKSRDSDEFKFAAHDVVKSILRNNELSVQEKRAYLDNLYVTYQSQLALEAEDAKIADEVKTEVQGITNKNNGYVYPVSLAGDPDTQGHIVAGYVEVDETDQSKPRIGNNEIVTVKLNDGRVVQLNTKELDLTGTPQMAQEVFNARAEERINTQRVIDQSKNIFHQGDVATIQVPNEQTGETDEFASNIVSVSDDGVEVEVIDPAGQVSTTVIPHDVALQTLAVVKPDSRQEMPEEETPLAEQQTTGTQQTQPQEQTAVNMPTFVNGDESISVVDNQDGTYTNPATGEIVTREQMADNGYAFIAPQPTSVAPGEAPVIQQAPVEQAPDVQQPVVQETAVPVVPNIETMSADELGGSAVEYMGDRASAMAYLEAERDKADAEVQRTSKLKVSRFNGPEDFKRQNDQIKAAKRAAIDRYNKLQNAITAANAYKTLAEQKEEAERKAREAALREQRRQLAEAETAGDIEAKWQNTKKTVGFAATKTLPNGQKVNGHYILTEAGDVVPSHDPRKNYADSEGYVMENGQNVNDNNYKDPDVQRIALDIAQNYGGQAVEQMPFLENRAGRVLSGNNRTISGIIAAENNTDQAYLAALAENAQQYGFTPEQLAEYEHPRLQFVVEDELPFTTATFAMFNQQEKKTKSSVNRAVANSKMVTEAVRDKMLEIMDQYDSLDSFFGSESAAADIVQALITEGLMTQQEVAGLTENTGSGFKFGQSGREYVTDMLLGTLFDEQTIKMLAGEKTLKQAILRALPSIVENRRLKGYELTDSINSAIKLLYEARKANEGKSTADAFQLYLRQVDAFEGSVMDRYNGFDIILANRMAAGVEQLREILGLYNNSAMNEANGQMGFFEPRTIDDIKQDVYEYYTNQQPELAAALNGAAARGAQPESAVPSGTANEGEVRPTQREQLTEYLNGIADEEHPFELFDDASTEELLRRIGASEESIERVKIAVANGAHVNGIKYKGRIYLNVDECNTPELARTNYVHERQHLLTTKADLDRVFNAVSYQELNEIVDALAKHSGFYLGRDFNELADEFISFGMEAAYQAENDAELEAALRQVGANDELVNIIKSINNEQRANENLSKGRRNAVLNDRSASSSPESGRDQTSEPAGVGEQGTGIDQRSLRRTEGGWSDISESGAEQVTPFEKTRLGLAAAEFRRQYPDKNVGILFREKDSYEFYDKDAVRASEILGLQTTEKDGVPFLSFPLDKLQDYLGKLVRGGMKIGITRKPDHKPTKGDYQIGDSLTYNGKTATIQDFTSFGTVILDVDGRREEVSREQLDDILDYGDYMYHVGDVVTYNGKRAQIVDFASGDPVIEVEGEGEKRYVSFSDIKRVKKETPTEDNAHLSDNESAFVAPQMPIDTQTNAQKQSKTPAEEPLDPNKPLNSLAEVKKFMDSIGYEGTLSKVLTDDAGKKFVKFKANGAVTPNIYLGDTTPRDIFEQFYLYDNMMEVDIPADIQTELEQQAASAKEVRDELWADDREQVKQILSEEGIPFVDVIDSEQGSRIIFTDRKNENGNYIDYMDVSDADQAREDIAFIRAKADSFAPAPSDNRETSETRATETEIGGALVDRLGDMGVSVSTDLDANRAALKAAKADKSDAGAIHYYKTPSGQQYGFSYKGRIYLDPTKIDAELPIHEYGHLWAEAMRRISPESWRSVVDTIKADKASWDFVRALRPELTDENEIAEEVIATFSGKRGAERLRAEYKKMHGKDADYKSKWGNIFRNISKAIQDFWKAVGDFLHIQYTSAEQVYDQVLKDFVDNMNPWKRVSDFLRQRDAEYVQAAESGDIKTATNIFYEALKENIGNGITPYMSVGTYNNLKRLAKGVKTRNAALIKEAAAKIAPLIPDNAVLIPAPSHDGKATDMLDLAKAVAEITGSEVADVLRSAPRESQYQAKKTTGVPMASKQLGIAVEGDIPADKTPIIIDNVVDSGNTAEACVQAIGKGVVVTLADSAEQYGHAASLKSAAPVLRDKAGKVIPLSKRFEPKGSRYLGRRMYLSSNDPRFAISGTQVIPVGEKTLVGLHNISAEKLRKVMKAGGLANPSAAVIDIAKQDHHDYGEVSLVMPSSLIDSRTGNNDGTYVGDAYTPMYPPVEYRQGKETQKRLDQLTDGLPKELGWAIQRRVASYMDSNSHSSGLEYLFLKEKGMEVPISRNEREYPHISIQEIGKRLNATDDEIKNGELYRAYERLPEDQLFEFNLWYQKKGDPAEIQATKERLEHMAEGNEAVLNFRKRMLDKLSERMSFSDFGYPLTKIRVDEHEAGKENYGHTLDKATIEIGDRGLRAEFDNWLQQKIDELGYEEFIFNGYTPSGNRRYLPNTIENASRIMNQKPRANWLEQSGINATKALLLDRFKTLEKIRKHKNLLEGDDAKITAAIEAVGKDWSQLGWDFMEYTKRSGAFGLDDNDFIATDSALARLQEAMLQRDPIAFLNREYRYSLPADSEFGTRLKEMVKRIKNLPSRYFETKFRRPVYLNEFANAVVPNDLPQDLRDGLQKSGLTLFDYDPSTAGSRRDATLKATEADGIRFSINGKNYSLSDRKTALFPGEKLHPAVAKEMSDIKNEAVNNGTFMQAPNGKPTNLNERQWLQVRLRSFKRWFGDWQNDPENASKVLDENGEPMVVWHRTNNLFNQFDPDRSREQSNWPTADFGFYFSNVNMRGHYGKYAMPVFLNIRNPRTITVDEYGDFDYGYKRTDPEEIRKDNDGLLINVSNPSHNEADKHFVIYNPNQAKSAIGNNGDFSKENDDIRFSISNQNNDIFYSNAERAVEGIKQDKATPEQWRAMIEKAGGLKAGEDKWIGLSDWLAQQRPTVTPQEGETRSQFVERAAAENKRFTLSKQDLLDYIREHKIQIEDVNYQEGLSADAQQKLDDFRAEFDELFAEGEDATGSLYMSDYADYAWNQMIERYGDDFEQAFELEKKGSGRWTIEPQTDYYGGDLSDAAKYFLDSDTDNRPIESTRLRYTTYGLDNKREIALTVPTIEPWNDTDEVHFGDAGGGRAIAWIRFGETHHTTENGAQIPEDVLVIDEIQSKRHQSGREQGYQEHIDRPGLHVEEYIPSSQNPNIAFARVTDENGILYGQVQRLSDGKYRPHGSNLQPIGWTDYNTEEEAFNIVKKEAETLNEGGVPDAPFEKNWHELAMKRILRFAAENGYDKVAWTTGEQQAKRYDIGKEIDHIVKTDENTYEVYPTSGLMMTLEFDENGMYADEYDREYNGKSMSDIFGKDLAKRLKEMPVDETLQGDGLRVGYDGMKGFYDDILPRFMQKYGKKWGVQVGEVTMPDLEEGYQTMHSVDITDDMRESVLEGQPMFSISGRGVYGTMKPQDGETRSQYIARVAETVKNMTPRNTTIDDAIRFSITVNHNSPYLLKRADGAFVDPETGERLGFDLRFIGKGEGGQAHGWGTYLSANDLRDYAEARYSNRGKVNTYKGMQYDDVPKTLENFVPRMVLSELGGKEIALEMRGEPKEAKFRQAVAFVRAAIEHRTDEVYHGLLDDYYRAELADEPIDNVYSKVIRRNPQELAEEQLKQLDAISMSDFQIADRHHYTVEIPDNDGTNYFEEDQPLTQEQIDRLRKAAKETGIPKFLETISGFLRFAETNPEEYPFRKFYSDITDFQYGYPRETISNFLKDAGFVGIHYDGRRDGECYVIFNPDDAVITDHIRFSVTGSENDKKGIANEDDQIRFAENVAKVATDAWNKYQYDGELESIRDVAEYIEDNMPKDKATAALFDAIDKWRAEEAEDRMLYGERGDLEPFEDAILNEIELLMKPKEEIRFSVNNPSTLSRSEIVTKALIQQANNNYNIMQSALKKVTADLKGIRAAMWMQSDYDRKVVDSLLNLYNTLLQENGVWAQYMPDTTRRIATQIVHAIGKQNITEEVNTIMDHMVHAQAKAAQRQWDKLRHTPIDKINISGVVMQGKVALEGQHALKAMNEALDSKATIEQLEDQIAQLMDMEDNATDESLKLQYKGQWIGLTIAAQHLERLQHLQEERQQLDLELQSARSNKALKPAARQQLVDNIKQAMRDNYIEQAEAYTRSTQDLSEYVNTQEGRAKDFIRRQDANRDKIRSYAQRDLEGLATNPNRNRTRGNVARSIWDAFASPIRDLQSLLRLTGLHAPDGEGYLYNHFMRNWMDGADMERTGIVAASKTLDEKIAELTHGKYKTWEEAARKINDASHNMFGITMLNGVDGKDMPVTEEIPLNAGNALYIYAVNKMNDGRMKLNGMNITEEDVQALADKVREQFGQEILDVVDWVQSEFFSQLRNRYNPTHEALFGAPMDAIENYFPLRINANARQQNEDLSEPDTDAARLLAGTSTGAIKRRTRNSLPLDVRNADFFQEVIRHISQMERWNAFAQWNRDANILFSDINFRNRIKGMKGTIYGEGDKLYNYMKDAFRVAIGTYKPKTDTFSEITLNMAKGVTSAKINFRIFTALKQIASFPAFFTYMQDGVFVGSYLRNWLKPHETMKWAKENLPNFEKRVSKRDMGDMRLMQRSTDWQWNKRILEWSSKYGMFFNVFFDTLTCATGARAVYDSHLADYLKKGYSEEDARNRARQDAEQAFNTSQQSSEGAFMSAVQQDRNLVTAALTVFRTSPIQYTRNFMYHTRNLLRKFGEGKRDEQIAFRMGQYKNDGLNDEQARKAAEKDYNKSLRQDIVGFVVYGALLNILWRLAGQIPYLLLGDDDDKKKQILDDATSGGAWFSPFTGLLGGGIVESALDGNGSVADMFAPEMPFTQDVKRAGQYLENDKYAEFANQALSVAMQSGTGFDPQTAGDMIQRIVTTIDSEEELSAAEQALRISQALLSIPQSQYEQQLVDRVVADESEYDAALADYIRYQKVHTAPLTWWLRGEESDEKAEENAERRFDRLLNERDELHNPEEE